MESVVRIHYFNEEVERFYGCGFLVYVTSGANFVLTCQHVVEGSTVARIYFPDRNRFDATVVKQNKHNDLALLRYVDHGSSRKALRFRPSRTPYVGKVYLMAYFGHMDGSIPIRPGISSSDIIGPPTSLNVTSPAQNITSQTSHPGTSGAPLLNHQNEVIGVNTQSTAGIKGSVTLENLHLTLEAWSNTEGQNLEVNEMLRIIAAQDP